MIEEIQPAYERYFPTATPPLPGKAWQQADQRAAFQESHPPDVEGDIAEARRSIEESRCYREIEFRRFPWRRAFRAEEYVRVLRTHSDHATLPPEVREPLLRDIAAAINAAGGSVTRQYEAVLMLARPAK